MESFIFVILDKFYHSNARETRLEVPISVVNVPWTSRIQKKFLSNVVISQQFIVLLLVLPDTLAAVEFGEPTKLWSSVGQPKKAIEP